MTAGLSSTLGHALLALYVAAAGAGQFREWLGSRIEKSTDVAWLERLAVDRLFTAHECGEDDCDRAYGKGLRMDAYVRLGAIGTPEGVAAVQRIEAMFMDRRMLPPIAEPDAIVPYPVMHTPDGGWPELAHLETGFGQTYVLLSEHFYGEWSLALCWRDAATRTWTRPFLVPVFVDPWTKTTVRDAGGGRLRVTFEKTENTELAVPPPQDIVVADIVRDSDGDGWTDIEERRLGTNPRKADSDGDGVTDDRDAAPLYRARNAGPPSPDDQILGRAFFALYGMTGAPHALFVGKQSRRFQMQSSSGPVLYREPGRREGGYGIRVSWQIAERTLDEATVVIHDVTGNMGGSTTYLRLRRIGSEWIVVEVALGAIS